jgi:RNase_H superfamily
MAKVLTLDIETQRAVVEVFDIWRPYIKIDQIKLPARILCFAAKWHDEDEVLFQAAWDDGDEKSYRSMITAAWELLTEADIVVTWNGNRFDNQWLEAEFCRYEMGPPAPYRSVDLFALAKKKFARGLMSLKLDWSSRHFLKDRKIQHDGRDLWDDIRYGNKKEAKAAQCLMMEYNVHDVVLTDRLFDRFLPWLSINFALYNEANAGLTVCPICESPKLHKRGRFFTTAYAYQRYRCVNGHWSKGKRMVYTNELRPA